MSFRRIRCSVVSIVAMLCLAHEKTCFATTYFVATNGSDGAAGISWAAAKQTIQAAVDLAVSGDTVLVSNGVYATGGRVIYGAMTNRVAITNAITVRSVNGPALTAIKGAWDASDTFGIGDAAVRCVYIGTNATLSGFTLTNGATRAWPADWYHEQSGGGVWCATNSSAIVSNCTISRNSSRYCGGGSFNGTLIDCAFSNNFAFSVGVGSCGGGSFNGTLNNCTLSGNYADYGGGSFGGTMTNCTLSGNSGLFGAGSYGGTLSNCRISGNSASQYGGGSYQGKLDGCIIAANLAWFDGAGTYDCDLSNCTVYANSASGRGGGSCEGTLNNCVLHGNYADDSGGGSCLGTLNNCILYDNAASQMGGGSCGGTQNNCIVWANAAPSDPNSWGESFNFGCTTPDPGGTGNITVDPQFVEAAAGNFHLKSTSPCINAGNNADAPGMTDLDGNPRIIGGRVDMGAFEYQFNGGYWLWAGAITNGMTNIGQSATADGYPNLLKFATGSSATYADHIARVSGALTEGFTLHFTRNTNADDVTLFVESRDSATSDMPWGGIATNRRGAWGGATNVVETSGGNPVHVSIADAAFVTSRIFRLRVTRP